MGAQLNQGGLNLGKWAKSRGYSTVKHVTYHVMIIIILTLFLGQFLLANHSTLYRTISKPLPVVNITHINTFQKEEVDFFEARRKNRPTEYEKDQINLRCNITF